MSELRRLVYGAVGLIASVAVNRITGLHIVLRHISVEQLGTSHDLWFALFALSFVTGMGAPMWFWLLRPMLTSDRLTDAVTPPDASGRWSR